MSAPGGSSDDRSSWRRFLPRPTYANVVSTIALFLALGGVAFASNVLPTLSVGTQQLKPKSVRTGKIANRSVTRVKIRKGAIRYAHLNPNLVGKLAGKRGPAGPQGARGPEGARGEVGANGVTGAAGADGADGATGPVGPQGEAGATGPAGLTGATGADGTNGIDGANGATGASGATGDTGPTGPPGATGSTGVTGATGPSGFGDLVLVSKVTPFTNIAPGSGFNDFVECPAGYTVISGGFSTGQNALQTFQSYPVSSSITGEPLDRWRAAYYNPNPISVSGNAEVFAYCFN